MSPTRNVNKKSITKVIKARFWTKVKKTSSCWLWQGALNEGYGNFGIDGQNYRAHRIAWTISRKKKPKNLCVLHKCDNPKCVNPAHLFLGTISDNNIDCALKGRMVIPHPKGENHPKAKICEKDVRDIRQFYIDGLSFREIACKYNISRCQTTRIVTRRNWGHVK